MKVQRVRLPEIEHITWLVLDDDYVPIEPILRCRKFLDDLERSPNTVRATAQHLKTFWQFLHNPHLDWTQIDVAHLAAFIQWLRSPDPAGMSIDSKPVKRNNATIDQMLSSVSGIYDFHMLLTTVPDMPPYRFVILPSL